MVDLPVHVVYRFVEGREIFRLGTNVFLLLLREDQLRASHFKLHDLVVFLHSFPELLPSLLLVGCLLLRFGLPLPGFLRVLLRIFRITRFFLPRSPLDGLVFLLHFLRRG